MRNDLAMTGEITLRGRVMPIGGLKEKVLAAHRGGIKMVLIPKENEKDIEEIPAPILKGVTLMMVEHMDDVLKHALVLADPDAFFAQKAPAPTPPSASSFDAEEKAELGEDEEEPIVSPNPNLS